MGLGLMAGRWFQPDLDSPEGPATSVVSRTLAEALWGNAQAALGQVLGAYDSPSQVVGVVESGKILGPDQNPPLVIYLPFRQHSRRTISYIVDTELDPASVFPRCPGGRWPRWTGPWRCMEPERCRGK